MDPQMARSAQSGRVLDFLSGYCVHNAGHNHPAIIAALKEELDRSGPAMLQSHVPQLAAQLALRLTQLAGGQLRRVFFTNSGSEGVEAAIKFSRAHTRRDGLLYADGAFHGLTCGALFLMSDPFWHEGFGYATRYAGHTLRRSLELESTWRPASSRPSSRSWSIRGGSGWTRSYLPAAQELAAVTARSSFSTKCKTGISHRTIPGPHHKSNPIW
jgi:hypothetical protein